MSFQNCQSQIKDSDDDGNGGAEQDVLPFEIVEAFPLLTEVSLTRPSAVDVGVGDVNDPTFGTRVTSDISLRNVYLRFTSKLGNVRIWKVTDGRFMFSVDDQNMRFITAYMWNGDWYVVWMPGSDPAGVTTNNMDSDNRVWQVHEKFSQYFIRLEGRKQLYLNSDGDRLQIMDVGDPDNTRNVSPLTVTVV